MAGMQVVETACDANGNVDIYGRFGGQVQSIQRALGPRDNYLPQPAMRVQDQRSVSRLDRFQRQPGSHPPRNAAVQHMGLAATFVQ